MSGVVLLAGVGGGVWCVRGRAWGVGAGIKDLGRITPFLICVAFCLEGAGWEVDTHSTPKQVGKCYGDVCCMSLFLILAAARCIAPS